jgi:hypothetical protein
MDGTQPVHLWFEGVAQAAPFVFGLGLLHKKQKVNAKTQREQRGRKKNAKEETSSTFFQSLFASFASPFPLRLCV